MGLVAHSDRILMGPGPGNPYPEAIAAFGRPMLGHLDPEFIALLDETNDRLRAVFQTANQLTFPVSATGSGGMEATFANVLGPDDVVVVGVNGVFGGRMCDVAERCGAEVVRVEADWGQPLDPATLLSAHPSPKVIAVVHAETSTGVRNDIELLGAGKGEALLLVDCVTSLGGIPLEIDAWGVDLAYSGTQKCLGVPPGLSPVTVSSGAVDAFVDQSPSWYFDFSMLANYVTGSGARAYHHTAPISMVFALHAGLGVILEEGLDNVHERHRLCGEQLQEGLVKRGFEPFASEGHRLPDLTSVYVPKDRLPKGVDEAGLRKQLLDVYSIEIGGGLGPVAGDIWRIGCMGHTARPRNVTLLLGALDEILQ
ncbi:MAG: alanine--glyoxylate aminotransferase family protein [Actinomycetota bacterium]|nr:alanine--glyoxylate aminotransferase family protein [Actinomycetota bacterium]